MKFNYLFLVILSISPMASVGGGRVIKFFHQPLIASFSTKYPSRKYPSTRPLSFSTKYFSTGVFPDLPVGVYPDLPAGVFPDLFRQSILPLEYTQILSRNLLPPKF